MDSSLLIALGLWVLCSFAWWKIDRIAILGRLMGRYGVGSRMLRYLVFMHIQQTVPVTLSSRNRM